MLAEHLIDTLIGVVLLLVGAVVKALWDAVKMLQKDMTRIEVALPTIYMPKNEFYTEIREIKVMLERITDKLDGKVDKNK